MHGERVNQFFPFLLNFFFISFFSFIYLIFFLFLVMVSFPSSVPAGGLKGIKSFHFVFTVS